MFSSARDIKRDVIPSIGTFLLITCLCFFTSLPSQGFNFNYLLSLNFLSQPQSLQNTALYSQQPTGTTKTQNLNYLIKPIASGLLVEKYSDLLSFGVIANITDNHQDENKWPAGNWLFLSDGSQARKSIQFSKLFPSWNITSSDITIKDYIQETLPNNVHWTLNDNTKPFVDFGVRYDGIVLNRGLCNHFVWKSARGSYFNNIGCAGIPLDAASITNLIAKTSLLLNDNGVFMLGGASSKRENSILKELGLQKPLSRNDINNIARGVATFNRMQQSIEANIHLNHDGLLIVGSFKGCCGLNGGDIKCHLHEQERLMLNKYIDAYFSKHTLDFRPVPYNTISNRTLITSFSSK